MNKLKKKLTSNILSNKLSVLSKEVQGSSSPTGTSTYQTKEKVEADVIAAISEVNKKPQQPLFKVPEILTGHSPNLEDYNTSFKNIQKDLQIIFTELEDLETAVMATFNYCTGKSNSILSRIKNSVDSLATYKLYATATSKKYLFSGDSFTSTKNVDLGSSLLSGDNELEVDTQEGIVTLPIDSSESEIVKVTSTPVMDTSSNGTSGNNYQYSSARNDDISKILDNNADTWFEYERVLTSDDSIPLQLEFTIDMNKNYIINHVSIDPVNFGAKTSVEISSISTSVDNNTFDSILSDLLSDEVASSGSLKLSPSTSKYAGKGFFSFLPRKARYIRIAMTQRTPYVIETSSGGKKKIRYAIGIRDVKIESRVYKEEGQLVSKKFDSSNDPIKKVLLTGKEFTSSSLASMNHALSPDNGLKWHTVQMYDKDTSSSKQKELVEFNTSSSEAIETKSPIKSLRYRLGMKRDSSAFKADSSKAVAVKKPKSELLSAPSASPYILSLEKAPEKGSVFIVDPFYGSRDMRDYRFKVRDGIGGRLKVTLPWKIIRDLSKSYDGSTYSLDLISPLKIFVDGIQWSEGNLSGAGSTDELYELDTERSEVRFGDGTNGKSPPKDAHIEVLMTEERLFPDPIKRTATLKYPAYPEADEILVRMIYPSKVRTRILSKGAKIHKLNPDMDSSYTLVFSDTGVFSSLQSFVNGSSELSSSGDYSIDYEKGVIYSYDATSSSGDTTVTYKYSPSTQVEGLKVNRLSSGTEVTIPRSNWATFSPESSLSVPSGVNYFNLAHLSIVRGSLSFSGGTSVFKREVPFVDGRVELLGVVETKDKISALSGAGNHTIPFKLGISSDTSLDVGFSNKTAFVTKKDSIAAISSVGDYYIERSLTSPNYGVTVKTSGSISNPGYVSYYTPDANMDTDGIYSIDYKTGEVFSRETTTSGITVTYQYSDYRVKYLISRNVTNFEVNSKDKEIDLLAQEILKKQSTSVSVNQGSYYRVFYKYSSKETSSLSEMEDYFTPALREYYLKAITESRMV